MKTDMLEDNGPLVVIVGETASGKSALALQLAQHFNGGIINADSWSVYRGFDIGTAKPSAAEQAMVPHYLFDIADPAEGFSAAVFQRLARAAIAELHARGRLPILVGGTGLYIDSLLYDYGFLPPSNPALRQELNRLSLPALLQRADEMELDTTGIDRRNKRRVIRLIENNGARPVRHELRPNTLILGLEVPRETLRERIEQRVDEMLAAGLEAEVRSLTAQYGWDVEAMKGIGYREWQPYLAGEATMEETRQRIIKSTMDLAKRQRTWFKRNSSIQRLDDRSLAVALVTTFLNKNN